MSWIIRLYSRYCYQNEARTFVFSLAVQLLSGAHLPTNISNHAPQRLPRLTADFTGHGEQLGFPNYSLVLIIQASQSFKGCYKAQRATLDVGFPYLLKADRVLSIPLESNAYREILA